MSPATATAATANPITPIIDPGALITRAPLELLVPLPAPVVGLGVDVFEGELRLEVDLVPLMRAVVEIVLLGRLVTELVTLTEKALVLVLKLEAEVAVVPLMMEVPLTEKALVLVVKMEAGALVVSLLALKTEVPVVWAKEVDLENKLSGRIPDDKNKRACTLSQWG